MQNIMLGYFLAILHQVKLIEFSTKKKTMVVKESIHVVFDEYNDFLQRRESVDDNVSVDFSMGRLQIEDRVH